MAEGAPRMGPAAWTRNADLFLGAQRAVTLLILAAAPLPFGSVEPRWTFALELGVALLGILWLLRQLAAGEVAVIRTRIALPLVLLFAYLALTLAPLAPRALAVLSPEGARLHDVVARLAASRSVAIPSTERLSLAPF